MGGFNAALEAEAGAALAGCERLVVVMMDSPGQASRVAAVLAKGGLARCGIAAGPGRRALAVSSLLPMAETRQALQVSRRQGGAHVAGGTMCACVGVPVTGNVLTPFSLHGRICLPACLPGGAD